ncbi:MAG: peptidoglycan editing factor PgeF [Pseudanabaenaceae cyanobacterium bins.68]|nr:peptidoglycan editing factor PgeF [Pseudanabaenaceae cyanobacterium bins.68]
MWQWQSGYLKCDLLAPWPHGFFGKAHAGKLPEQLVNYFGCEQVFRVKQVHGDRCLAGEGGINLSAADGIYTLPASDKCSVWVCSADCVPILLGDRHLGLVAAIHAGWRGTAAGIIPKMLTHLATLGTKLPDLAIALGPAISGANYQVELEVANQVISKIAEPVGITLEPDPNHVRLDLRLVQQQQLLEAGIDLTQIAIAPYCTFRDQDLFFSYRRDRLTAANYSVQWSGIANFVHN